MARRKGQRTVKRGERRPSEAPESDEGPDADELGESSTVQAKLDMAEVGEDADEAEAGEVEAEAASERSPDSVLEPELTPEPRQIGRYQLLFELARGGMGTVHVGRQIGAHGFDRLVAIKRLKADGATADDVEAFLAEARVSAKLSHPNVVQTVDVGEHAGLPFLVMDLVEGVSLSRLIRRVNKAGERLDPSVVTWIGVRIAEGLHAAHELTNVDGEPYELVHRDVSPENVLLSYDGQVLVVDFGVAKFAGAERHQTQSGVVKGKFAYMSPEQTEARDLDRRSDVFALGIVLHECLTGERLFAGRSVADTVRRIWQIDPPDPSEGRQDVSPALGRVVLDCLTRERDDRIESAAEVAEALRGIMRAEGRSVDESDLSRLIAAHFAEDRQALRERIREGVRLADEEAPVTGEAAKLDATDLGIDTGPASRELGSVTASVTSAPAGVPKKGSAVWPLLLGAAAVAGGLWWWVSRETPPVTGTETLGSSAEPVATATATATSSASESPEPSAKPSASVSVEPVERAPTAAPKARPPSPIAPAEKPAPANKPAPAPKPASVKGVPFKSL
ncbi:MAG: serine/threonine-protein kinase [Polyangiaceae bacterium]